MLTQISACPDIDSEVPLRALLERIDASLQKGMARQILHYSYNVPVFCAFACSHIQLHVTSVVKFLYTDEVTVLTYTERFVAF